MKSFSEKCRAFSTGRTTISQCAEVVRESWFTPFPNLRPLTSPRIHLCPPLSEAVPTRMLVCLS
jgi:hypothetical protein